MLRKNLRAAAHGVACVVFLAAASPLLAHGDVHDQIDALTKRIAAEPENAELRLRRGELRRVHGDTELALADYREAARLDPSLEAVGLCVARAFLEGGRPAEAAPPLERALARRPDDAEALLLRARVHAALGETARAAALFPRALAAAKSPTPDLYAETARALAADGRREDALAALESGLSRLGHPVSLEEAALEMELALGRTDAALARLGRLASASKRPERWLARRAEVLERAGRPVEAREAFTSAVHAIETLPPRLRASRATAALEESVRAGLARVPKS